MIWNDEDYSPGVEGEIYVLVIKMKMGEKKNVKWIYESNGMYFAGFKRSVCIGGYRDDNELTLSHGDYKYPHNQIVYWGDKHITEHRVATEEEREILDNAVVNEAENDRRNKHQGVQGGVPR